MRGKLVASLMVMVLFFILVSGCTLGNSNAIVGTWVGKGASGITYTFTFNDDGSFKLSENGNQVGTYPPGSWTKVDDLHYKVVGNILSGVAVLNADKTSFHYESRPEVTFTKK